MNKFKIGIISLFFLLISMSFVNAEHSNMANGTVIVDDNNFDSYFDNGGCLINNSIDTIYFGDMSNKSIVIDKSLSIYSLNSSTTILNSCFKITEDGSNSILKNLNFVVNYSKGDFLPPIYID